MNNPLARAGRGATPPYGHLQYKPQHGHLLIPLYQYTTSYGHFRYTPLHMITYSVGSSREGGPLDGGSLVDPIVPQHNLTRVGSSYHKVRVELRKTARHHGRLKQTNIWYNSTVSICFLSQFYYCQSHNTFCSQHRKSKISINHFIKHYNFITAMSVFSVV